MIIEKNKIKGSEFWVNSSHLPFRDILIESRIPGKWSVFSNIEKQYHEYALKPINRYVSNLYPKPELISYDRNSVRLRQYTHAEIWVEPQEDGLYALDKTWQRQFYPSENMFAHTECFDATYKFYMPWLPDFNISGKVVNPDIQDPVFIINENILMFNSLNINQHFIDVPFVHFKIKKQGPHMKTNEYGIIDMHTPMYDLILELPEQEIDRVRRQFG